ncbi:mechanosensitive ion channel [Desulfovibrio sp. JY]|nr:mechanosensitive ion channel [Desulfovibrio sp. JY]
MPRMLRLCIVFVVVWLGLALPRIPTDPFVPSALAAPANGAKQPADKPDKDDAEDASPKDWQVLLSIHQDALVQQAVRFKSLEGLLPKNVRHFRTALSDLQSKLDALNLIISISGGNPWEMRAVLSDMSRLRQNAQALIDPFANSRDEIDKIADRLDSLKEEFSKHLADGQDQALTDAITYYLNYIKGVRASLAKVRSALEKQLGPAKDFLDGLAQNEKTLKARLPKAWQQYYFTPVGEVSSLAAWSDTFASIQLWLRSNMSMIQSLIGGADSARTLAALVRIAIGFFILGLADFMAALRLRRRYPDFKELKQTRRIWLLVGLGWLFSWVAGDAPMLLHEFLNALAEIFLAAALVAFAEMLARLTSPTGKAKPAVHLRRLWLLFSLGLLLQIGALPDVLMTVVWMVLLLVFFTIARKKPAARTGPSRLAGGFTPALYILLCLMTAIGWQHLAVLALAGWFLFLAAIETGAGLSRLVAKWQDKAAREGAPIVTRAVVSGLGFPLIFLSLFFLVLYWFSTELGGQEVFAATVSFAVKIGDLHLTVGGLALVLTGFFVTRSTVYVVKSFIHDLPRLQPGVDPGVRDVLDTTSTYLLWGFYAMLSLFLLGFSFTSLAVVAGGLSVGIGFGLQNIVNNFIAGLILLFGRSIQAGDIIQIDTTWGKVSKVNIRNTVVKTFQNATLFVPNSDLISGKLINWTHRDATMRRDITVGVAYGSDTGKVRDILLDVARAHPHVLQNPSPSVQFSSFGDSSLNFLLMVWVDNVAYGMDTESDIRFSIDRRFREGAIEIPFPQCDVRIIREPAPLPDKTPPGDA